MQVYNFDHIALWYEQRAQKLPTSRKSAWRGLMERAAMYRSLGW